MKTSNPEWWPFRNLKGSNNFNNPLPINPFRNLGGNNPSPSLPPANLFDNIGGSNSSSNYNNPLTEGLD